MGSQARIYVTPIDGDWRAGATEQTDKLGTIRWVGNKCYKFVKWAASASAEVDIAANGNAVGYSDYSANLITADATDADEGPAGVIVNFANWTAPNTPGDLSDRGYGLSGWIQIKGPATVPTTPEGSPAAMGGIYQATSSTDLLFTKAVTVLPQCGWVLASGGLEIYLDCPY